MRRALSVLIGLGFLVSACVGGGTAASPPAAPSDAGSESPSAPPVAVEPDEPARTPAWAGPVRPPSAVAPNTDPGLGASQSTDEEGDAALPYADIARVAVDSPSQPHWRILLTAAPPTAATLDPARTIISYGLAFETTGDEEPDHVVGISNEASPAGDFRVWVTDLATGETEEQLGPPYGFPVEFSHPDEGSGEGREPGMVFTFLGGSRPPGVTVSTRFYAWASVTEDGAVAAWDYAPDVGWLGAPPEAAAPDEAPAEPIPVGDAAGLAGFPECQADAFDFVGRGTLRELGLHAATPVPPPDIDRVAMIWVTRDLMPHDAGPEGGPIEMTRMLCFEFADGSGGSGWPVDAAWRPPAIGPAPAADADTASPPPLLLVALLALLLVTGSVFAFRTRR